jgi:serine/threonine protein kinase
MSTCIAILKSGVNKGNVCGKKVKNDQYCGRHIAILAKPAAAPVNTSIVAALENIKINKNKKVTKTVDLTNIDFINNLLLKSKNDSYTVIKLLGNGSFGYVYLVNRVNTNDNYALKLTYVQNNTTSRDRNLIYWENNLLSLHLFNCTNVTKLAPNKSYFNCDQYAYIITNYYEETLETRLINKTKINNKRIKYYGYRLVKTLRAIHNKKYIYVDIKPENVMFETTDDDEPILIDFGLTILYKNCKNDHITQFPLSTDIGTPMFSSIFANSKLTPDRYGDLQSIGYLLLYLYNGTLPWDVEKSSEEILEIKKELLDSKEFDESPDFIKSYITKTYDQPYGEDPDYVYLLDLLRVE